MNFFSDERKSSTLCCIPRPFKSITDERKYFSAHATMEDITLVPHGKEEKAYVEVLERVQRYFHDGLHD